MKTRKKCQQEVWESQILKKNLEEPGVVDKPGLLFLSRALLEYGRGLLKFFL